MVKNITGGNKTKKQKRYRNRDNPIDNLMDSQMYGVICENLGQHMMVLCSDGIKRKGELSGRARKGPRLLPGSYVAVSLREFEIEKKNCDILGVAHPPSDIISLFKKNDKKDNLGIPFLEEEDDTYNDLDNQQSAIVEISEEEDSEDDNSKDYYGRATDIKVNTEDVWKTKEESFQNSREENNNEENEDDDWLNLI